MGYCSNARVASSERVQKRQDLSIAEEAIYWRTRSLAKVAAKKQAPALPNAVSDLLVELGKEQAAAVGYCYVSVEKVAEGKAGRTKHVYDVRTAQRSLRSLESLRLVLPLELNSFGCIEYLVFEHPVVEAVWRRLTAFQSYGVLTQLARWDELVMDPNLHNPYWSLRKGNGPHVQDADTNECITWRNDMEALAALGDEPYAMYSAAADQGQLAVFEDPVLSGSVADPPGGDPLPPQDLISDRRSSGTSPPKDQPNPQLELRIETPNQLPPEALLPEQARVLGLLDQLSRGRLPDTAGQGLAALLQPYRSSDLQRDVEGLTRVLKAICVVENDYDFQRRKAVRWPNLVKAAAKWGWDPQKPVAANGSYRRLFGRVLEWDDQVSGNRPASAQPGHHDSAHRRAGTQADLGRCTRGLLYPHHGARCQRREPASSPRAELPGHPDVRPRPPDPGTGALPQRRWGPCRAVERLPGPPKRRRLPRPVP